MQQTTNLKLNKIELTDSADITVINPNWDTVDTEITNIKSTKADKTYVDNKVADLVDSAPEALNTLKELSTALGDDPNFATTIANEIGNKVDKVEGKGLSTNDFTTEEKNKLAGIATGANNYTHPNDANTRHVTDTEKASWNGKLDKSGGTMTGDINFSTSLKGIKWSVNTDGASITFKNDADSDPDSYLDFNTKDNNTEYFRFSHTPSGGTTEEWMTVKRDGVRVKGNLVYHTGNKPTPTDIGASPTEGSTSLKKLASSVTFGDGANFSIVQESGNWWQKLATLDSADKSEHRLYFSERQGSGDYVELFGVDGNGEIYAKGNKVFHAGNKPKSSDITDATSSNIANTLVKRDDSGNISVGTVIGALNGNASTATKLLTARTIALSGVISGSGSFDGSGNLTIYAKSTGNYSYEHLNSVEFSNYYKILTCTITGTYSDINESFIVNGRGNRSALVTISSSSGNNKKISNLNVKVLPIGYAGKEYGSDFKGLIIPIDDTIDKVEIWQKIRAWDTIRIYPQASSRRIYKCEYNTGVYSSELPTTATSTVDSSLITLDGGNADTVDGKHASDFLPITGGTVTGVINGTFKGAMKYSLIRPTSANLDIVGDGAVKTFLSSYVMTIGKPAGDGFITHYEWDSTAGWSGQLYVPNNTGNHLAYRSMNQGTWGDWHTVYSTGNKPTANDVGAVQALLSSNALWTNASPMSGKTCFGGWHGGTSNGYFSFAGSGSNTCDIIVDGDLYAKENKKVYHEGNKPTASDVGALATTGGTLTGDLKIQKNLATLTLNSGDASDTSLIFDRGGGANFKILDTSGVFKIQTDWNNGKVSYYDLMTISNTTGDAWHKGYVSATKLISTVATGTAPLTVSSTTVVTNLNADLLDGYNSSSFARLNESCTFTKEQKFYTGTWVDPANGVACAIKASGKIIATDEVKSNTKVSSGNCSMTYNSTTESLDFIFV